MATAPHFEEFMREVRKKVIGLLLSSESGTVTIHCSRTNQLRCETNNNGESVQMSASELAALRAVPYAQN